MSDATLSQSVPPKPNPAVLEERWLHAVMVFFQSFQNRAVWLNWATLLLTFAAVYGLWHIVSPAVAFIAGLTFAGAALFDVLLLWRLPRWKLSFGPVASQALVMSLPRLGAVLLAWVVAILYPAEGLALLVVLQLTGTVVFLWGMVVEPHRLSLTQLTVTSPHLPTKAPPVRLLHLSDLHVERLTRREQRVLEFLAETHPDVIVITGDYLNLSYNNDPESIAQVRSLLAKIQAPHGVFATLGSPPVDLPEIASQHFRETNIHLLRHNVVDLDLGQGRQLTLLGMDCTHDMTYDEHQFSSLFAPQNGHTGAAVFLYHSPELMPTVQKYGIDLYLCGHTHGGQVRLPGYGALLTSASTGKRYEMGRYDENGTTLYVSRGIGLEGLSAPRLRLFCPPEITLVTLIGAEN